MTNPDEVKDKFYEDLNAVITTVPSTDKLIILGDFNVRVGSDSTTWEGVIGQYRVGNCNSNGLLLLQTCAEHGLLITNTIFHLPNLQPEHHGCILTLRIGVSLIMSSSGRGTGRMCRSQELCVVLVLDRPLPHHLQAQPPHPAQETSTGHENTQMPECQQAKAQLHQAISHRYSGKNA